MSKLPSLNVVVEHYREMDNRRKQCRFHCVSKIDQKIFFLLKELQNRRKSDLRPADKFLSNTLELQLVHLKSELIEIEMALHTCLHDRQGERDEVDAENEINLIMEIVDLQMSCETMLAILGLDELQRRKSRKKVVEKNRKRGYYKK